MSYEYDLSQLDELDEELLSDIVEGDEHIRKDANKHMQAEEDEFAQPPAKFCSNIFEVCPWKKDGMLEYNETMNMILGNPDRYRLRDMPTKFWKQSGEMIIQVEWYEFESKEQADEADRISQGQVSSPDQGFM